MTFFWKFQKDWVGKFRLSREIPTESGFLHSRKMHSLRAEIVVKLKIAGQLFFGKKILKKKIIRDPDFVGTFLTHSKFTDLFEHEKRGYSVGLIREIPTESGIPIYSNIRPSSADQRWFIYKFICKNKRKHLSGSSR